jgi:hypothetical protein
MVWAHGLAFCRDVAGYALALSDVAGLVVKPLLGRRGFSDGTNITRNEPSTGFDGKIRAFAASFSASRRCR